MGKVNIRFGATPGADAIALKEISEARSSFVDLNDRFINTETLLADIATQIEDVSVSAILSFNTVDDLKNAYPGGLSVPAWIKTENAWYYWAGNYQEFYMIESATSYGSSGAAGWKGNRFTVSDAKAITEFSVANSGSPVSWELWKTQSTLLNTKLAQGTFNGGTDAKGYLVSTLGAPVSLSSGSSYVFMVNYSAAGAKNASTTAGSGTVLGNKYSVIALGDYYVTSTTPSVGLAPTTTGYAYDTRIVFVI